MYYYHLSYPGSGPWRPGIQPNTIGEKPYCDGHFRISIASLTEVTGSHISAKLTLGDVLRTEPPAPGWCQTVT